MKQDLIDNLVAGWSRQRPDLDATAMQVVGRIMRLGAQFESSANLALKEFGLNYTDLDVLATLCRSGQPYQLTPTQLRETVVITSGAMTACLDRLQNKGLLERHPNPDDRRGLSIVLTQEGFELINRAIKVRFENAADCIAVLSDEQQDNLAQLLKTLSLV